MEEIETITKEKEKNEITSHNIRKDKTDVKRTQKNKYVDWGINVPHKEQSTLPEEFWARVSCI